jgi:hypothetical protein
LICINIASAKWNTGASVLNEFFHDVGPLRDPQVMREFHATLLQLQLVDSQGECDRPCLDDLQSYG